MIFLTYLNVFAGGKAFPSSGVKPPSVSSILNEPSLSEQLLENVFKLHPERWEKKRNKQMKTNRVNNSLNSIHFIH